MRVPYDKRASALCRLLNGQTFSTETEGIKIDIVIKRWNAYVKNNFSYQ